MPEYARNDYPGRHLSPHQQRLHIMAAGATPGLPGTGAVLAARKAGQYAPPGQRKRAMARQALGPAAAVGGLLLGGRAGARAAAKSPRLERGIRRGYELAEHHQPKILRKVHPMKDSSAMSPSAVGRVGGALAGKIVAGGAVTQAAISRNISAEDRFNRRHRVSKMDDIQAQRAKRTLRTQGVDHRTSKFIVDYERGHEEGFDEAVRRTARSVSRATRLRAGGVALAATGTTGGVLALREGHRRARVSKVYNPDMLPTVTSRGTPRKVHKLGPDGAVCGMDGAFGRGRGPFAEQDGEVDCGMCLKKMTQVAKSDDTPVRAPVLTRGQVKGQVRRKRLSAALNVVGGTAGLGALALVGAKHPAGVARRERLLAAGAGIGGFNALNSASIAHREAKAEKSTIAKRAGNGWLVPVAKAAPIQTTMDDKTAHKLVHGKNGYGLAGPLPHGLDRPTRMSAYEARYVAAGGRKSQHWQKTSDRANKVGTASVAGATVAGGGYLAAESARARKWAQPLKKHPRLKSLTAAGVKHGSERAAVAAGVLGGAASLVSTEAKRRRASYASAPGGVAASNLRRMRDYTPGG